MIRNYLKQTIRDLLLKKGYFIINLLGLIIGITAFTLIVLWIKTETSSMCFTSMPMTFTGLIICCMKKVFLNNILRQDHTLWEEK